MFFGCPSTAPLTAYLTADIQSTLESILGSSLYRWLICIRPPGSSKSTEDSLEFMWLGTQDTSEEIWAEFKVEILRRLRSADPDKPRPDFDSPSQSILGNPVIVRLVLPLGYRNKLAGICVLEVNATHPVVHDAATLHRLSKDICYLAHRCQISLTIHRSFGNDLELLGTSPALHLLDIFIERAAPSHLPALILGETGCEKDYLGYALHVASDRCARPFELIECAALEGLGIESFQTVMQRGAGSLFLQNIDKLSMQMQIALAKAVSEMLSQSDVRLLASASSDLGNIEKRKQFYAPLLRYLDFLSTTIPPLRERSRDIPQLTHSFLQRYRLEQEIAINDEVLEILSNYTWPENVEQLQRVVGRMAVLGGTNHIGIDELRSFAPEVLQEGAHDATVSRRSSQTGEAQSEGTGLPVAKHLLDHLPSPPIHPGIQKAVDYISKCYNQGLTLRKVAQHACLSCSHLCFLLKKDTGMSFKTILTRARVEKAKELLTLRPDLRITDVSQEVGFGELSHFERMFKRIAGCSPKQYRLATCSQAYKLACYGTSSKKPPLTVKFIPPAYKLS